MNNFELLVKKLKEKNLFLGSVESVTGGGFANAITAIPGASNVFKGSLVTYATSLKTKLANVPSSLIEKHGVVSGEVASSMAEGGKSTLDADICVSITGNAGPSRCEGCREVGDVYIGISFKNTQSFFFNFKGERNEIKVAAINKMCEVLLQIIE